MTTKGPAGSRPSGAPTVAELRAFVVVAEELHFRRAASRLGVAPPPLSKLIRRLEKKLDAVLMERTPRTVRLTPAGRELLPRARDILRRMAEAQLAVREVAETWSGPFTVGVMSNGFAELTGPILDAFITTHPRVRMGLRDITPDPGAAVLSGAVDAALVRPPITDGHNPRLVVEPVVLEERAALLSGRHPLADADQLSIVDLIDEVFVAPAPGLPEVCDFWTAAAEREGQPARLGAEAWSVPDVLLAVGHLDNVITSFPSLLRFFNVPGIVAVPLIDVAPAPMALVRRADDRRQLVSAFRESVFTVSARMIDLVPGAALAST